jgi:hypothetical protein
VVDVVAVPDRLEQAVREPKREHVLDRLLAEEVVDPEDALLVEDRVHDRVQRAGGLEVGAERLLHDHARAVGEADLPERLHDPGHRLRRHREVVEPLDGAAEVVLRAPRRRGELVAGTRVGARIREVLRELPPAVARLQAAELLRRLPRERAELVVAERPARGPDHPVPPREQARLEEVVETGEELAAREVARRAEEDDDVVLRTRPFDPERGQRARDDGHAGTSTGATPAVRAAPRSAVLSLRITRTGMRSSSGRIRPFAANASMNAPSCRRSRSFGAIPPPR